jgi:ATP adenylyltransferase
MNQLWAPWRMAYIADIDKTDAGCVFCGKVAGTDDKESLVLHRGKSCFVILNLFPYNNGHILVIPYAHVAEIKDIGRETSLELWELLCRSQEALKMAMHPDGFNIGVNLGRVAGAGIDTHLHAHIVPRWNGDTNFMPVIGETKVISQALGATYDALLPIFRSMA